MRVGTIGTGTIVNRFIQAMKMVDNVTLEAVYSRSEAKAKAFAQEHNVEKCYSDLDAMLEDPNIDTIYIASPNSLHFPQALKALEAGKHVIDEKPFTSTLEECDILINKAKEKKLFLFEAITTIHLPNYKIIKDALPKLGDIHLLTANFSQFSSRYGKYKNHEQTNAFDPKFSGGALMDINIYNLHFAIGLFGKPNTYTYYPNIGYNGIDTSGVMILRYDTFTATLIGAKDSSSEYLCFVQGDKSSIKVSGSSTGGCKDVTLVPLKGDQIDVTNPIDQSQNIGIEQVMHMMYEVEAFETIIRSENYDECYRLLDHTRNVMDVMYHARKDAGIIFAADK
ncbi:putative dehydrogenase [Breznakia sp. PF5-3]|uniref:Gfo/Idh/MocA family protein n=1 Tax=unclassified Breznakia TaxID=2623764 RepID=UPI0024053456|nr:MULTISPECIES: Gfo/Idh/MocA family oxidoreductase [unclassified Breznakia]MDL2276517.1 Gfo/Idh/MocA family oxidoreductase [Breznakia sp. OttesenSCG-928-G09]MDF9825802.1 putative dehydrogenase [Breznakia sp. PM6-1]MDF9836607.1 putative dehydrogenase [Breznakia sp. PF5-3]MDF9838843.1 putative dehydrogenase [Breznakia sp. PFB2-8]MDF9860869.1 putative dehydrogenase [Breznakia sp. PH5-24]